MSVEFPNAIRFAPRMRRQPSVDFGPLRRGLNLTAHASLRIAENSDLAANGSLWHSKGA